METSKTAETKLSLYEESVILKTALRLLLDATAAYVARPDPRTCNYGELWKHAAAIDGLMTQMDKAGRLLATLDNSQSVARTKLAA